MAGDGATGGVSVLAGPAAGVVTGDADGMVPLPDSGSGVGTEGVCSPCFAGVAAVLSVGAGTVAEGAAAVRSAPAGGADGTAAEGCAGDVACWAAGSVWARAGVPA
ncbi:hypothetical protein CFR79_02195 [Komagataeibacter saccharivorans]|nr:hypothetical protein CFR79_02195 [Komagataeibacter saccharivorans]